MKGNTMNKQEEAVIDRINFDMKHLQETETELRKFWRYTGPSNKNRHLTDSELSELMDSIINLQVDVNSMRQSVILINEQLTKKPFWKRLLGL
jgi:hypothetical protein